MLLIGAIVVNPKTGEPFFCTIGFNSVHDDSFSIRRLSGVREGSGYFETSANSSYYVSAADSGYPRVHTPNGVATKGQGNGTCLYVGGACVVAARQFRDDNRYPPKEWPIQTGVDHRRRKAGVSSTEERSEAADEWWERAVDIGLASEQTFTKSEEVSVSDCRYGEEADEVAENYFNVDISSGSTSLSVCIDGTIDKSEEFSGNVLEFVTALDSNLVVGLAWQYPLEWHADHGLSTMSPRGVQVTNDKWPVFNREAARAVNVGVFQTYEAPDQAFALWGKICLANRVDEAAIEDMRQRFEDGLDIAPSSVMGVDDPRSNPSRKHKQAKAKRYGVASRRNPSSDANALANALAEERRRLGWDKFINLP